MKDCCFAGCLSCWLYFRESSSSACASSGSDIHVSDTPRQVREDTTGGAHNVRLTLNIFLDYSGEVEEALKTIEEAIILDFNNPVSLLCICRACGSFWSTLRACVSETGFTVIQLAIDQQTTVDDQQTPDKRPRDNRQITDNRRPKGDRPSTDDRLINRRLKGDEQMASFRFTSSPPSPK